MVYDPCTTAGNGTCGSVPFGNEKWELTASGQLRSVLGNVCAELQDDKSVTLNQCASPATAAQQWKYDNSSQQLTTGDGGMCVTASNPTSKIKQNSMVIGRPLGGLGFGEPRSFALLFLNNHNATMTVTCDATCMRNLLAMAPKDTAQQPPPKLAASYAVQEVWSGGKPLGAPVKCSAGSCSPVSVSVACCGGTVYVRLVPEGHQGEFK